jgi:hypothetical protein
LIQRYIYAAMSQIVPRLVPASYPPAV